MHKKYNSALPIFNKCYNIKNDDYDVSKYILSLSKTQEYELVIKFANEAIEVNPDGASAYQNLAECYLALKFEEAEKNSSKAIELRGGALSDEVIVFADLLNTHADSLIAQKKDQVFIDFAKKS